MILPGIGQPLGDLLYAGLIILFTFFYTAVSFDPNDVSENIKKYGGFIPGIRPGRPTSEYLTRVVERLTMVGALVLAGIAVLPIYLARGTGVLTFYLAGTSLLIVRSEEHTSELQSQSNLVCRLLLEKKTHR